MPGRSPRAVAAPHDPPQRRGVLDIDVLAIRARLRFRCNLRRVRLSRLRTLPAIGPAVRSGLGLAIGCDITLLAEDARLAFPEVKAGLPPTIVMSYLGRLIPRKKAFELVITGREMNPQEAERLGLVNQVVPSDQLVAEGERWVSLLLKQNAETLKTCKDFFRDTVDLSSEDAVQYGVTLLANFMSDRSRR